MQSAITMKSSEDAPVPAAVSGAEGAAVAPEIATVSQAAPVLSPEPATASEAAAVVAPEPTTVSEAAPVVAPEPAAMKEGEAKEEAEQQGAEDSALADGDGKSPSLSPAPVSSPTVVTERQIPVDPASLRRLGMVVDEDSPLSAPSVLTEVVVQSPLLPPLRRPTFVGASLPCSAVSSPVYGHGSGGAKWKEENNHATPSPRSAALSSLARQHSAALARLVAAAPPPAVALSRSASRAEGRTMAPHHEEEEEEEEEEHKALAVEDGSFTCGALCLLIPGFSRKKPAAAAMAMSSMQRQPSRPRRSSASRVASLERFECGSWSPPPPPVASAARDSNFDAVEVPKVSCADETESPVKMAFVFDGEAPPTRGILKTSASSRLSSARPSTSSQRHVRFSTAAADVAASCPSSPSGVVSPRLARARAEFNAFLEAQSA